MKYVETLRRLQTLLELFRQHKEVRSDFLLKNLNLTRTTLQRDIENLRNLGHEIEYCRKKRLYILIRSK
jgi:predicted DNA-binding transcriptional regulator YafY